MALEDSSNVVNMGNGDDYRLSGDLDYDMSMSKITFSCCCAVMFCVSR